MPDSSHPEDHNRLTLPGTTDPPSSTNPPTTKVWLIFGATGHIGRSIVKSALQHNDMVCAVGQTYKNSLSSMTNLLPAPLPPPSSSSSTGRHDEQQQQSRFLPLLCDVRLRDSIAKVISTCLQHFGAIDIIANCSGYGVIGAFEDQDEHEIRNQFETNFMGTLNIIQLSLPYFRERGEEGGNGGGGRYVIFSSTSGAQGVPGLAPYCATKYAVEGLIESMLYEVDGFGIKVTLVEPGHVRRDEVVAFGGNSPNSAVQQKEIVLVGTKKGSTVKFQATAAETMRNGQKGVDQRGSDPLPPYSHFKITRPSAPYSTPDSPSKHAQRLVQWYGSRHQPTSVVKAAELVWQLGHCSYPPLRLLLGTYAVESVREKLRWVTEEIEDWKHLHYPVVEGWDGEEEEDSGGEDSAGKGDKRRAKAKRNGQHEEHEGDDDDEEGDEDDDLDEAVAGKDVEMDDG